VCRLEVRVTKGKVADNTILSVTQQQQGCIERDDEVLISLVSLRRHNHGNVFLFRNLHSCNTDWTWQIECGFNIKYYHIQDMKQSKRKYCRSHRMCNAIQSNELNYGMEQSLSLEANNFRESKKSPPLYRPKSSLPYSQQLSTSLFSQPDEANSIRSLKDPVQYPPMYI
jgi:hypothetical protein